MRAVLVAVALVFTQGTALGSPPAEWTTQFLASSERPTNWSITHPDLMAANPPLGGLLRFTDGETTVWGRIIEVAEGSVVVTNTSDALPLQPVLGKGAITVGWNGEWVIGEISSTAPLVSGDTLALNAPGLRVVDAIHGFGYVPSSHTNVTKIGGWELQSGSLVDLPGGRAVRGIKVVSEFFIRDTAPGVASGTVVWWGAYEAIPSSQTYSFGLGATSVSTTAGRAVVADWRPAPDRYEILTGTTVQATAEMANDTEIHVFGISWDETGIRLYRDGVLIVSTTAAPSFIAGDTYRPNLVSYHPIGSSTHPRHWFGAGWWPEAKGTAWHLEQARRCGVAP